MSFFSVVKDKAADFLIEEAAFEGVKQIGVTVAEDIETVSGKKPQQVRSIADASGDSVILMATVGNSPILEALESEGKIDLSDVKGKREVYLQQVIEDPFKDSDIKKLYVIAGSDKRGTIYGMFSLSEYCGVSPLVYFGDAAPKKQAVVEIEIPDRYVSKEPSVKYRGFFINDEWPAFGGWCNEHFGGFNAKVYKKVFELLLRLKGNYMWPAMWSSIFSEDGPGLASAELADTYGVIMGTSHHEPLYRAGEEWKYIHDRYGDNPEWSFLSNAEAISKFWEDGVKRNKHLESVVTIGMRGECDSKLLPEDATLKDNIEVIKSAIRAQHEILKRHFNDLKDVPRMLAIYKEVEDYYFGDETCEGLKDWDELKDVIFLLSDDNFGNLRAIPTEETRNHPGGYGMYYHFDYHGSPISYEWVNCNRLTKTWEQMTQAYESGVRDMWIVNVGDLKEVEYPLCYFMALAYDYDKWGLNAPNMTETFLKNWIDQQFADKITDAEKEKLQYVIDGYTKWNSIRTPESMNFGVFDVVNNREAERVYEEVSAIKKAADELNESLTGDALITYQSIIYYAAATSLNMMLAWLEAEFNREYAKRGVVYANTFIEKVRARVADDVRLVNEFHKANDGKWNYCMASRHTGFRSWDANDWTYPTVQTVFPNYDEKIYVSFRGSHEFHLGHHWQDTEPLTNDDFTRADISEVVLDIDSRGAVSFNYEIEYDKNWLIADKKSGRVDTAAEGRSTVVFTIDRSLLKADDYADIKVNVKFDSGEETYSELRIKAAVVEADKDNVIKEKQGTFVIAVSRFTESKDADGDGFRVIEKLGREGSAIKALPPMKIYDDYSKAPFVKYTVDAKENGEFTLDLFLLARNPAVKGGRMKFAASVNDGGFIQLYGVPENYYTEWICEDWGEGVLRHARTVSTDIALKKGINNIYIYAGEPGVIIEKLVISRKGFEPGASYLGPKAE